MVGQVRFSEEVRSPAGRRLKRGRPVDWRAEPGRFWVYVLQSGTTGKLYIGQTNDLSGRLRQHNDPESNRSLYTKRTPGPWVLAHVEEFPSRREAMARERFLKTGQGRDWLRGIVEGIRK